MREVYDLFSAADIVLASWCLRLVNQKHEGQETAKALFPACASELGGRDDVLRVWESVCSTPYAGRSLANCFGVIDWSMPRPERPRVSVVSWGSHDEWITDGFIALLLIRPPTSPRLLGPWVESPPPFELPEESNLKSKGAFLLGDETPSSQLLGIEPDKRGEVIDAAAALLSSRTVLLRRKRLRDAVNAEIEPAKVEQFAGVVQKAFLDRDDLARMLANSGYLSELATDRVPSPVRYGIRLPKQDFISGAARDVGLAHQIAQELSRLESFQLAYVFADAAQPIGSLCELSGIRDVIISAAEEIARLGYTPSWVFVPLQDRFVESVTADAAWQLPNHRKLGRYHAGQWNEFQLIEYPYENSTSIVVIDPTAFFGGTGQDTAVRLTVEDCFGDDHQKWVADADKETDPSKITDPFKVSVAAHFSLIVRAGVCDPRAAGRIDLELSKMGYALQDGEAMYHRAGCGHLRTDKQTEYSLGTHLHGDQERRNPCEHCRPDEAN